MRLLSTIFKRQLACYAGSPATYVSVAIFLALTMALGLYASRWLEQDIHDLRLFFHLHPWLYLLLMPALATQLWSDESHVGFRDLMKTLPVTGAELAIGKFLAAWVVAGWALILTFPLVIFANFVGNADNSVIASQLLASWLLSGSYLSVGCFICTFTRQRTVVFILTSSLLLIASGLSSVVDALEHQAPIWIVDSLATLNPHSRFSMLDSGKLTLHDSAYFISIILAFLTATTVTLNYKNR